MVNFIAVASLLLSVQPEWPNLLLFLFCLLSPYTVSKFIAVLLLVHPELPTLFIQYGLIYVCFDFAYLFIQNCLFVHLRRPSLLMFLFCLLVYPELPTALLSMLFQHLSAPYVCSF